MSYSFFASISRMKYIERWALMRNSREETLSEHSLEVAMIAHALCVIAKERYHRPLNAEKAALIGIYHDAPEIITGDMPTPVKYSSAEMKSVYKEVEADAQRRLLGGLPEDLKPVYEEIFSPEKTGEEVYLRRLVKAADKLSAYINCIEEEKSGNTEFATAKKTIRASLAKLEEELPEVSDFVRDFLPSYGKTLDELNREEN